MSWTARRKLLILLIIAFALIVVVGVPSFFLLYKAPSCTDGIQNQGEEGIDCGGPCMKLCQAGFVPPQELWATSSQVVSGIYNLLAYVANPNAGVYAPSVSYAFKLYDSQGVLINERDGQVYVPNTPRFAIFEPSMSTGTRVPYRTFFQFTSEPQWANSPAETDLSVTNSTFVTASTSSRLDATVLNSSLAAKSNIQIIAIMYDSEGNALAFSKSLIPSISQNGTTDVFFTWPFPITTPVARKEFLFQDNLSQ